MKGDTTSKLSYWRDGVVYVQFDFTIFQFSNSYEQIQVLLN